MHSLTGNSVSKSSLGFDPLVKKLGENIPVKKRFVAKI